MESNKTCVKYIFYGLLPPINCKPHTYICTYGATQNHFDTFAMYIFYRNWFSFLILSGQVEVPFLVYLFMFYERVCLSPIAEEKMPFVAPVCSSRNNAQRQQCYSFFSFFNSTHTHGVRLLPRLDTSLLWRMVTIVALWAPSHNGAHQEKRNAPFIAHNPIRAFSFSNLEMW